MGKEEDKKVCNDKKKKVFTKNSQQLNNNKKAVDSHQSDVSTAFVTNQDSTTEISQKP